MIRESEPITLPEVSELARETEKEANIKKFVKKFAKADVKFAKQKKEELKNLGILKLKDYHIIKIIDFLPQESSDLNEILEGVSLDQDEINKILDVIKK